MKARRVKGLDPDMTLADAAERIVRVRLDELYSFMPRALDPGEVEALHDLRIAAKRLRYVLEVTGPFLGEFAPKAAKRARDIQDLVGEIHDCDVQLPQVLELIGELRARDAADLRRAAGDADDLAPSLAGETPHRGAYRGLEVLAAHLQARRALLFEHFLVLWDKLDRQGFRARLEEAIGQRSFPEPEPEPRGDGDGRADRGDALRRAIALRP
jgi:CHAD domain-containing protein